jgi:hypothetical protein
LERAKSGENGLFLPPACLAAASYRRQSACQRMERGKREKAGFGNARRKKEGRSLRGKKERKKLERMRKKASVAREERRKEGDDDESAVFNRVV